MIKVKEEKNKKETNVSIIDKKSNRIICNYDPSLFYIDESCCIKKYLGSEKEVVIPDGVTSIGFEAFCGKSMRKLVVPVSLKRIVRFAFDLSSTDVYYQGTIEEWCDIDFDGPDANPIRKDFYINNQKQTEITIPDTVTEIKNSVFANCTSWEEIIIPNSVTSIGDYAFARCENLTSVVIPDSVTNIGEGAFDMCYNLESIAIPDSVNSIGEDAFNETRWMEGQHDGAVYANNMAIDWKGELPSDRHVKFKKGTKAIVNAHAYRDMKSIEISDSVANISKYALCYCDELTNIEVDPNNQKYKSIDGNLYSKDGSILIQYAIGKRDEYFTIPDSVTKIGSYAFYHCERLTSITIPGSVVEIGEYAFAYCNNLKDITIGDSVVLIKECAFYGCTSLTSIFIPDSVTCIASSAPTYYMSTIPAFEGCDKLTNIEVDINNQKYKSIDGNLYSKDGTELIQYALGKEESSFTIPDSVTSVGKSSFYGCENLINITIGVSVSRICDSAFCGCRNLKTITIGDSVTSIGSCSFSSCYNLETMIFGEKSRLKRIGEYAFIRCNSLKSISIPGSVTKLCDGAFAECNNMRELTILGRVKECGFDLFRGCNRSIIYCKVKKKPNKWHYHWNRTNLPVVWNCNNNDIDENGYLHYEQNGLAYKLKDNIATVWASERNLKTITILDKILYNCEEYITASIGDDAFSYCDILNSITIPYTVTSIGKRALYGCKRLASVSIPNSVTSIGDKAFSWCESFTDIVIPESVTSISSNLFSSCKNLRSIVIPDSVTGIGESAFWDCNNLANITIGDNVTNIGDYAYANCESLIKISIPDSVTSIGSSAFTGCYNLENMISGKNSQLTSIGHRAFDDCESLEIIRIPDSVTSIGEYAFRNCDSLTIYCEATGKPSG